MDPEQTRADLEQGLTDQLLGERMTEEPGPRSTLQLLKILVDFESFFEIAPF